MNWMNITEDVKVKQLLEQRKEIKELTDFYMWMQENDYAHNIRARVERKAEMYLNSINVGHKESNNN